MPQQAEARRRIDAPAARVWDALTDLEGRHGMLGAVDSVTVLTPGPFAVGTRWRETRRMFGRENSQEMAVTACEPPRRFVTEAADGGARYVTDTTLGADPSASGEGATVVRIVFTVHPPGGPAGLLARVVGGFGTKAVRRGLEADLAQLAAHVEARPGS